MSKANTIPEFLGILVGTIAVFSVGGVIISMAFEGATKTIKNKLRVNSDRKTNHISLTDTVEISKNLEEKIIQEKPIKMVEDDLEELEPSYSVGMKETLRPLVTQKMFDLAVEECHNVLKKGSKLGDMELALIIKNKSNMFKEQLIQSKDEINMRKKDINNLVDDISVVVIKRIIDMTNNKIK